MKYLKKFKQLNEEINLKNALSMINKINIEELTSQELSDMGINIGGLKCDNSQCGWSDMTIKFEEYKKYLNSSCPKCGENILTEDDYNETCNIIKSMVVFQKMDSNSIQNIIDRMSEEDMDKALDTMNDYGMKKTGENEDGSENWTIKGRKK